jgi:hypothetical protein
MERSGAGLVGLAVVGLCLAGGACAVGHAEPKAKGGGPPVPPAGTTGPAAALPASLDAHYPPQARGPAYQLEMHALSRALEGLVADVGERDLPGARANLAKLKASYARVSRLVPEWRSSFPAAPLAALEAAVGSGDPGRIMPAVGGLGQVCHSCHVEHMGAARLRYHWPTFETVEVEDPLTKEKLPWGRFKQRLSTSFTGVGNDLEQGQRDNARAQLKAFKARFVALQGACQGCHESERHHYVDKRVTSTIARLERTLNAKTLDPTLVQRLSETIGRQSCAGCHNVHVPGSMAQRPGAAPQVRPTAAR